MCIFIVLAWKKRVVMNKVINVLTPYKYDTNHEKK